MVIPQESNEEGWAILMQEQQWLPVNIVLGMPQKNCQYHGICRIDMDEEMRACSCPNRIKAKMCLVNGKLYLRFVRKYLPEITYGKHFASGYFVMLVDFQLPLDLQQFFQTDFIIRRGVYPVREMTEWLEVVF